MIDTAGDLAERRVKNAFHPCSSFSNPRKNARRVRAPPTPVGAAPTAARIAANLALARFTPWGVKDRHIPT
jgi:hypothetical protein